MSKGGSPPAQPDYVGAARAQGQENLNAARVGAQLNRVDQVGPTGSVRYTRDPNNPDHYIQTTELSPEQQQLYGSTTANAQNRADIAGGSANHLAQQLANPISFSGLPERTGSVGTSPYRTGVNADSVANRNVDLSGVSGINSDFTGERQRVEDALYGSATKRLDPQFDQREEGIRSQLMNQGIREGSEAWGNAMREFENQRSDAYGDARDRSIAAGGAEQSRLFADALAARQQGVGEQFGLGEFANQAAQQEFGNEALRTNLYNVGQQAGFDQNMSNAYLGNQARDQGINETLLPRNQAMSEFMQLYGDYAGGPQASGIPGVSGPAPADIQGAMNQGYQYQTDMYNYDQQRNAQNMNSGVGLASALMLALSDRRAKTDIERIGELPNGLPTYRFKYKGEDTVRKGVMSDEVREVMPEAVVVGEDGFDRVNYAMINAAHLLEAH